MLTPGKPKKYPGRDRVLARSDARAYHWDQSFGAERRNICQSPYHIAAIGLPSFLDGDDQKHPVEMAARCRKCPACLQHRRELWTARARSEVRCSGRTWFGTLTFDPQNRFIVQCKADKRMTIRRREPLASLSPDDRFKAMADEASREVTLWLKRVRKEAGPFRYLLVSEAHSDGFPHFHLLIHEDLNTVGKLTKRILQGQWRSGFSHMKLVKDERAASYACKYLNKSALTRVRASQRYGRAAISGAIADRLNEAAQALSLGGREASREKRMADVGKACQKGSSANAANS